MWGPRGPGHHLLHQRKMAFCFVQAAVPGFSARSQRRDILSLTTFSSTRSRSPKARSNSTPVTEDPEETAMSCTRAWNGGRGPG